MLEERLLLIVSYIAVACLVLIFGFRSNYSNKFKIIMICMMGVFYFTSWETYKNILGWPSSEELPENFNIIWVLVLQPDKKKNTEGEIYLWISDKDSFDEISKQPRAYQITWNEENHKKAQEALHKLKEGEQLNGRKSYGVINKENEGKKSNAYEVQEGETKLGAPSFEFNEVPPLDLPAKTMILD